MSGPLIWSIKPSKLQPHHLQKSCAVEKSSSSILYVSSCHSFTRAHRRARRRRIQFDPGRNFREYGTMSNGLLDIVLSDPKMPVSTPAQAPAKTSRSIRNNQKWDSVKDRIYCIYMVNDCTLQDTMRAIAERYGFKARYVISRNRLYSVNI
jgi:hypothetical protein